ncbi:MAG: hypothetical protein CME36_01605 [unclassified Hahellaceae]|nr:hypothetical protein [Hahellaceae bacterium]|tara:strand:+ start:27248 stop:28042 length:795 start_codon:yes stop_codon:yes gene_type:complete
MSKLLLLKRMPQAITISIGVHALFALAALMLADLPLEQPVQAPGHTIALSLQGPEAELVPDTAESQPTQSDAPNVQETPAPREAKAAERTAPKPKPAAPVETATSDMPEHPLQDKPTSEALTVPLPLTAGPSDPATSIEPSRVEASTETNPQTVTVEERAIADPQLLADYRRSLQALLEKSKRYPPQARLRRMEDEVIVSFTINEKGGLETCTLVSSAGFGLLDDAALAAIRDAAPFPAPPAGLAQASGEPITFEVPIVFQTRS